MIKIINRICFKCNEYVDDVWTFVIRDDKEIIEFSGHKKCVDQLEMKVKSINDLNKKMVSTVLNELGLNK